MYGEIGRERGATKHTRTLTILGSPRNGEARWPDQVVDTMSAEGRSLQVDGLGISLAWSPWTRRANIRTPAGCPKACRALLPIPNTYMLNPKV
jgi:hypothetical protein